MESSLSASQQDQQTQEPQKEPQQEPQQKQEPQQQQQQQQQPHAMLRHHHHHHNRRQLPPKPSPVPFGTGGGVLAESPPPVRAGELLQQQQLKNDSDNARMSSIASESSRHSLQQDMQRLRSTLTVQEHNFLTNLCMCGNDVEVQIARENLLDPELFFPFPQNMEAAYGNPSCSGIRLGSEVSRSSITTAQLHQNLVMEDLTENSDIDLNFNSATNLNALLLDASVANDTVTSAASVGSERRQRALEERKNNFMFGKMWKAHQNGLAMTREASRRSLLIRNSLNTSNNSMNMSVLSMNSSSGGGGGIVMMNNNSSSRRELYQRADEIFRARCHSSGGGRSFSGNSASAAGAGAGGGRNLSTGTNRSNSSAMLSSTSPRNLSISPRSNKFLESRSDNNRRLSYPNRAGGASFSSLPPLTGGGGGASKVRAASISLTTPMTTAMMAAAASESTTPAIPPARPFPKPVLRRMQSEGSTRKEVTFGDLPPKSNSPQQQQQQQQQQIDDEVGANRLLFSSGRDEKDELLETVMPSSSSFPKTPLQQEEEGLVVRPRLSMQHLDSLSSIPSIHLAHSIRSPESSVVMSQTSASGASFPSLHLAHHIHSVGSASTAAIADESFLSTSSTAAAATMMMTNTTTTTSTSCDDTTDVSQEDKEEEEGGDEKKEEEGSSCHTDFLLLRPVLIMGDASVNSTYEGIGIEVQDSPPKEVFRGDDNDDDDEEEQVVVASLGGNSFTTGNADEASAAPSYAFDDKNRQLYQVQEHPDEIDPNMSKLESLMSFGDNTNSLRCNSFDETMSHGRISSIFRRTIRRSLSDADLTGIFLGGARVLLHETSSVRDVHPLDETASWVMDDEMSDLDYYDTWKVIEDEYDNGYGGGGTLPFQILGTSADDLDSHPHVLSPPLIESLQAFLPIGQSGSNFWMKYSLVRDGANMMTLLQQARGARYAILALETIDGEVFGAYTTEPWRKNWNTFGGGESFLWRMRHSRNIKCHSIIDQAQKESIVDVYHYTGENNYVQFCTQDFMAVGGGEPTTNDGDDVLTGKQAQTSLKENDQPQRARPPLTFNKHDWGFGLSLGSDLLTGTSSPCVTFGSPSLSTVHKDGSQFEIINLELWTLTPCTTVEEAEKLELSKLFLEANANRKIYL